MSCKKLASEECVSRCLCNISLLVSGVIVIADSNSDGLYHSIIDTEIT